ncbi:YeiH family putative sulfate export transporter [Denitratisoma sp. agr-D3]
MANVGRFLPGLGLVAGLCGLAGFAARAAHLDRLGISAAALGILLGAVAGNLLPALGRGRFAQGVAFAQTRLLRWGIVCFGFHLSLQQLMALGRSGLVADLVMVASTLLLGLWLGRRLFRLDAETALLTAVGSAICGAAAIAATAPLLKARTEQATAAVGTVVLFGTLGMVIYPWIHQWAPASLQGVFGIYVGSTVHEVAQVVAIGSGLDDAAAGSAVVVKMLRVLMLMPFLLLLGWMRPAAAAATTGKGRWSTMPWFALGFIATAALNSSGWVPAALAQACRDLGGLLLAAAMTALGLGTTLARIRGAGAAPLLLAALLFGHLLLTGALVNSWLA